MRKMKDLAMVHIQLHPNSVSRGAESPENSLKWRNSHERQAFVIEGEETEASVLAKYGTVGVGSQRVAMEINHLKTK